MSHLTAHITQCDAFIRRAEHALESDWTHCRKDAPFRRTLEIVRAHRHYMVQQQLAGLRLTALRALAQRGSLLMKAKSVTDQASFWCLLQDFKITAEEAADCIALHRLWREFLSHRGRGRLPPETAREAVAIALNGY